ncbi:chromatin modification-related protein EAF7-domain-containing protein [Xylariaceae sp. FL0016]|nr:chromatin modification-related protein EAF7-domain-containing protein [Xylariaceae sp. FL0016]
MPPKRKSKALAEVSTPKASATPAHDDDMMDVDTPQASETPRAADTPTASKPNQPPASEILNDLWTEDQMSSLFKAIIRWKPSGVHKHFRMISISEHLRNHGFDPDVETHTRIPGIWKKLREFYNMDMIDERDNAWNDENPEEVYKPFDLPPNDFHDLMWARAMADHGEQQDDSTAEAEEDTGKKTRKRKRGDTGTADGSSIAGSSTAKTRRSSTVEDTEQDTPTPSSPVGKSARGARSQKRAAVKKAEQEAEAESDDSDEDEGAEDEESGEEEDEESDEDNEDESEENEIPATRASGRGSGTRGRGRGRGRGKGGRKRG